VRERLREAMVSDLEQYLIREKQKTHDFWCNYEAYSTLAAMKNFL